MKVFLALKIDQRLKLLRRILGPIRKVAQENCIKRSFNDLYSS
jgi:hypothetical protein